MKSPTLLLEMSQFYAFAPTSSELWSQQCGFPAAWATSADAPVPHAAPAAAPAWKHAGSHT